MARPHWLTGPGKTRTPAVVVSFDTETRPVTRDDRELLTLRCWDALIRVREPQTGLRDQLVPWEGEHASELAEVLEAAVSITGEAWAFAHNVGFDLTVTSLPMVLEDRGWTPQFINIGDESCVFSLKRDGQRLVITDSWSWLRCSLENAARSVGMRKVALPGDDDPLAAWHHRCAHDVAILDRVVSTLLDWWDRQQLGGFGVTGASCGWRSLKAHTPGRSVLVGTEPPRTELERSAIFGGRREVWQVGRVTGRWVEDWDLVAAHLTTVASYPMPLLPIPPARVGRLTSPLRPPDGYGAVVRCRIRSDTPVAPVKVLDDVWWPVGEYVTTLTSPELAVVLESGADVGVLDAQWYQLGDALQPWANWCLGLQGSPPQVTPTIVKRVAKGWGRSVPGRFAMHTSTLIGERTATHLGWAIEPGHDLDTGDSLETITYGGTARTFRKDQDGADVSPVVLAFVEGYVRAAIARTLASRPAEQLLQVNTDGWWEIRPGRKCQDPAAWVPEPYTAARKAVSRDVNVIGPNHTDSKGDRRLAGIPKDSRRDLDGTYHWHDWPGLRWQLQFSRPGEYLRPGRELQLADHYCRRWVLTTGETIPVSAALDTSGQSCLLPWSQTAGRREGDELAEWQVPALTELADVEQPWQPPRPPDGRAVLGRR